MCQVLNARHSPVRPHLIHDICRKRTFQAVDNNAGAFRDTGNGDGLANARCTPGDKNNFVCKAHGNLKYRGV